MCEINEIGFCFKCGMNTQHICSGSMKKCVCENCNCEQLGGLFKTFDEGENE